MIYFSYALIVIAAMACVTTLILTGHPWWSILIVILAGVSFSSRNKT